jgi:hypothetical protein
MSTAQLTQALSGPARDRPGARREARRPDTSETAFSAQIAAFYPYPRASAEPAARMPPAGESRLAQVSPSATLGRRRQGREG